MGGQGDYNPSLFQRMRRAFVLCFYWYELLTAVMVGLALFSGAGVFFERWSYLPGLLFEAVIKGIWFRIWVATLLCLIEFARRLIGGPGPVNLKRVTIVTLVALCLCAGAVGVVEANDPATQSTPPCAKVATEAKPAS
ncbi:MAG TPA: hypothetical protein VGP63_13320 [Planctomycetaceae bacterium]|nr:hypothetical protein [Planctomycetaceae bacterium]